MKKVNILYFFICSIIIFLIIYGGSLYNIYIHPTEVLNTSGEKEILLFGDFKYLFKVINCHNLGFNVYSSHDCYKDYYGSYVYGPTILFFPSISSRKNNAKMYWYFFSTTFYTDIRIFKYKINQSKQYL